MTDHSRFPNLVMLLLVASLSGTSAVQHPCGSEFPWDSARLPQTILPVHYDLVVHPNLTDFTFRGSVNIVLNVTQSTDLVVLNAADLEIENIRLRSSTGNDSRVSWKLCSDREQLAVTTEELGLESYNLSMKFRGNLTGSMRGLYKSSYKSENGSRKFMAITQFSPVDARRMYPCWDEPLFKATFSISVIRDPSTTSLSNMPLASTVPQPGNLLMDRFETTLKMSTYLTAVAVFDFSKRATVTKSGVEITLHAPQVQIDQASFALDAARDSLEFHESFLKIPFPLKKLDIVAVGDFAFGAMENWGLMTFRDTVILYDQEKSSTLDGDYLTQVVSHEIGHQWFGNLVTMKWWADLWLKEGFARFLETFAAAKIRPEWGLLELFGPNVISVGFNLDGLKTTHPVYVPVGESSEIRGIFDAISYNKGASIIYMLLNILGEENMAAGLNDYLTTYQYSNAEGAQFWMILSKHAPNLEGQNLNEIADSWTLQPGYPYVTVSANKSGLLLRQQRFYFLRQSEDEDHANQTWTIPFTFRTDLGENKLFWFNSTEFLIPLDRSFKRWFKANSNGTGFYRVLYTPRIWRSLAHRLRQDPEAFSTTDRSNLIIDAFGFARAGLLNLTIAFDLAKYLRFETEYGPWKAAIDALDYILNIHIGTPLYEPYTAFVRSLLEPVYKNVSWTLPAQNKEKRFVAHILNSACGYDVGDCRTQAIKLFNSWKNEGAKIDPNLLGTVMTEAIRSTNEDHWDLLWKAYLNSNVPSEKSTLLTALSSTPRHERLMELLNASLDPTKIRPNLLALMPLAVSRNPNNGMKLLWQFTKDNWDQIYKLAGGTAVLGNFLGSALVYFSEQADFEEIQGFFLNRDVDGAKRSLDQTMEKIQINVQWRQVNDGDLKSYTGLIASNDAPEMGSDESPFCERHL